MKVLTIHPILHQLGALIDRIMKTLLVVALVLVLVLNYGSALKCNHCVPQGGTRCTQTQETCDFGKDACIAARFNFPPFMGFRRCSSMTECLILSSNTAVKVKCCQSDLCNNMVII
ncbi:cytotoxin 6-like [Sinocyclocheilus grahami]|uniref:Cytotoxin 6-like n=1 Tax=Sinocyclocheilus grahami TaxID=75366 RepID=A0A672SNF4_SINGR|nr:PREDICTED: cytotoxin 6-like [Sinocyclocheilus grahami]